MAANWFPGHMNKALKEIETKIPVVDAAIEIVDARAPYSSQNPIFRRLLKDKTTIYIMSKTDLADPFVTDKWVNYFNHPENGKYVMKVEKNSQNITGQLINIINQATKESQDKQKAKGIINPSLNLLVIGLPNVGKSTFINKLTKAKKVKAGNKPGLTRGLQQIKLSKQITLFDTPGIMPSKIENESVATNLVCINAVKEDVFPLERMAARAIRYVYNNYPGMIEERYTTKVGLYPPIEINSTYKIFEKIARNNKWILLDDMPDVERVMRVFLKDLQDGRVGKISYETPDMISELIEDQEQKAKAKVKDTNIDVTSQW